jgi:acyl dehydratase
VPDLYFEDLLPGREFDLGTVTIDRDEMIAFAQRFDPQPFHVDEQAGKESIFGQLAASGWYTSSLWMRAYVDHVLSRAASLGSPGGDEVAWPAPVFAGDELTFSLVIDDARRSKSRPTMGLVTLRAIARRGDTDVYRGRFVGMFSTRD